MSEIRGDAIGPGVDPDRAEADTFGRRLHRAMAAQGPLCVGVDPHPALMARWGVSDSVAGLRRFCDIALTALSGRVALVKPQSAFFERHGSQGIAVLEDLLAGLRDSGTLSVLDVKRGDIGSTMTAYADAYCDPSSPLAADAITASPFLGFGSLEPLLESARRHQRGVFVLALTSNRDGAEVQHARTTSGSVAQDIVASVTRCNARELERTSAQLGSATALLGSVGLVVGATVGGAARALGLDLAGVRGPLLCPGIGAQGADPSFLPAVFGAAMPTVVPAASREILSAGPDVAAIQRAAERLNRLCVTAATT